MKYLEFWDRFQKAEQKANAFDIRTIGYQLYPMLRTRLYYQLAQDLGIFDNPHPNPEPKELAELDSSPSELIGKAKIVVVPFVRTVGGLDVYSQPLVEALGSSAKVLRVIDPPSNLDVERIKLYGKEKFDRIVYELMLKEKVRDVRDRWAILATAFEGELGISLGKFAEFPNWLVRRYIGECMAFKEMFEAAGTKKLYVVNAYSHPALVVGAKQAGAKVIEIQHGFISEFHPAYSYPNQRIQSAPDRILVWGSFWSKSTKFPKGCKPIVTGPSSHFLNQRSQVAKTIRIPKTIMFTSQGALGIKLLEQAILWAKTLVDHQITFRLHPNEDLAEYQKFDLPINLTLSHKTPTFLELLGTSEYLVGGFSTTLYEGVSFGSKVIVLPLEGYENVNHAINLGDMTLGKLDPEPKELIAILAKTKTSDNPYSYYAKEISIKAALRA